MSHDLTLTVEENKCDHCNRSDISELAQYGVSYNHCWIWYQKFNAEYGFRAIYHVPLVELIPKLEKLKADTVILFGEIPTHKMNDDREYAWSDKEIKNIDGRLVRDDGWATTNFNAYRCINELLEISKKMSVDYPQATWKGD